MPALHVIFVARSWVAGLLGVVLLVAAMPVLSVDHGFTKLCMNGQPECRGPASTGATPEPGDWACTRDNKTKLLWSLQSGLGDWAAYAQVSLPKATNSAARCGFSSGWRLPTRRELLSLVHHGLPLGPMIEASYFPDTFKSLYWTSDTYLPTPGGAWSVDFNSGATFADYKTDALYVRLVRGAPVLPVALAVQADGTVLDTDTGLVWDQCPYGLGGSRCTTGKAFLGDWTAAMDAAERANANAYKGFRDWRVPSKNELESIARIDVYTAGVPSIDTVAFPGTPVGYFWTSTSYASFPSDAWYIYFKGGNAYADKKTYPLHLRLVRDAPSGSAHKGW